MSSRRIEVRIANQVYTLDLSCRVTVLPVPGEPPVPEGGPRRLQRSKMMRALHRTFDSAPGLAEDALMKRLGRADGKGNHS